MKEFFKFVKKEFLHIFRDGRTMLIVLVMPVVQIILFGFAISTDINNVRVDIVGDMADNHIKSISEKINNNKYLDVVAHYNLPDLINERFKKAETDVAVCFEKNFSKKLGKENKAAVKIVCDGSDPNTAQMISNYITGILNDESTSLNSNNENAGKTGITSPSVVYAYNPLLKSSYNFVPGVMGLILMLICSMMTAISIVREKENGTMELLLVSPVKPVWIITSKALPYMVLSITNLCTILLLSRYVIDVPIRGNLMLISFVSLIFILTALAIGLLISTIASSQRVALLISGMGLMMPTMIFSGIIFPCESMPVALQYVSDILPAKWYIIMIKKIMIEGTGITYILKELSILSFMMIMLFFISIRSFRTRF